MLQHVTEVKKKADLYKELLGCVGRLRPWEMETNWDSNRPSSSNNTQVAALVFLFLSHYTKKKKP